MPRRKTPVFTGSAELDAMVERAAPAILALLADGTPRTKAAVDAALAGRHDADDVALTLVRLAVTGRVVEAGSKYTLATGDDGPPAAAGPQALTARQGACGRRPEASRAESGSEGRRGCFRREPTPTAPAAPTT